MANCISRTLPNRPCLMLLATWLLVMTTGCGKGAGNNGTPAAGHGEGAADAPRVLRISQGSDLLSWDPYDLLESPTFCIQVNVLEPLTDMTAEMKVGPCLAESWANLSPTVWEFKLRQGVKFHGGEAFDAEDVRYSLKRALEWPLSRAKSEIPTIKEVRVVDPHTVQIETSSPDAIIPTRLATILILDKESSEAGTAREGDAWFKTHANGTGPYKLAEWRRDSHCLLEANEEYRNGSPRIKKLNFLAMSNSATRVAALMTDQIDLMLGVPVHDVERVRAMKGYRVESMPSLRLIYLGVDVSRDKSPGMPDSPPNPFKDPRVRRAVYEAINIDLIIKNVMNGLAAPADQLFPDAIFGFNPEITRPKHDPEHARKLLAEAGFSQGFRARLDTPNDRYVNDSKIAAAIAQQLAQVGITVEVNAQPKAAFFTGEKAGDYSFFLIGWANTNGDGNGTFDHLLHTMDPEKNLGDSNTSTLYSNPEVDRLVEASATEFDPEKRLKLLQEAVRLTMNDLPHIPLHYQMDIYAISERLDWTPRRDMQFRGFDAAWK